MKMTKMFFASAFPINLSLEYRKKYAELCRSTLSNILNGQFRRKKDELQIILFALVLNEYTLLDENSTWLN